MKLTANEKLQKKRSEATENIQNATQKDWEQSLSDLWDNRK